ncbi:MAG: lipoyl(octanoyl) transferase LipB [Euryarchaeota archaeon]|nr:lipoyl(octanoyl) transferase LipB [Euryarchaeota archaeon]MDE1836232.1 lipoyl(octanoyl) transferase LipB [Euryarchaeota archaeon]MDE1880885.1 lipoyl(octanoyl) transferase LipB [Euryarchaeota archaeon]MDE2045007.1 lipoyl(octanoyl) transferase LipB [Thermoplasmata archaeon]
MVADSEGGSAPSPRPLPSPSRCVPHSLPSPSPLPEVRDLGHRPYQEVWDLMRELRRSRRAGNIGDTLLLVEHEPVITVGVQGSDGDVLPEDLPVYHIERGGKSTFHGPGQLVGYPIVDLTPRGRDVRRFVHELEEMVARAILPYGIAASRVAGKRGVWVAGERKIASVGVAVEEWVTFHGFALNISTDLRFFERFHPCGFEGRIMTSMERELKRPVARSEVVPRVVGAWKELFGTPG